MKFRRAHEVETGNTQKQESADKADDKPGVTVLVSGIVAKFVVIDGINRPITEPKQM